MSKQKSPITTGILVSSILGAALLTLVGIGFMQPTGEQSKLVYNGKLWCVSNFIEQEPVEILSDGRPRQDKLLDGKSDWIVRDQIEADSKAEAEAKSRANGHGLFEPSDKVTLRATLTKNPPDQAFFTSHFNEGATIAGPCLGTGSSGNITGSWLNEKINQKCGLNSASNYETVAGAPTQAVVTKYSPNMGSNKCDSSTGGGANTSDNGTYRIIDGRIRYTKGNVVEDYALAEPSDNPIIPWDKIDTQGVVIEGVNNNKPIKIHDHYAVGNHTGKNYLDLFLPCGTEYSSFNDGISRKITVVDLTKPIAEAADKIQKMPDGAPCPEKTLENGPSAGSDIQTLLAKQFEAEQSARSAAEAAAAAATDGSSLDSGTNLDSANLPDGVLNVPPIDESQNGLVGQCNRAAAGMAYLYRVGKTAYSGIGSWLNSLGATVNILSQVKAGVVDRKRAATSDNWTEIRDQVVNKKNPVVLATDFGGHKMHYITITGFVGSKIYFNDGAHFVANGSGVAGRWIEKSTLNTHLLHSTDGYRFLYAKPASVVAILTTLINKL